MSEYLKKSEQAREDSGDLIAKLEKLGQTLDSAEYPGRAWAGPSRRGSKWAIRILAASAAAAAILLIAFTIRSPLNPPKPAPERQAAASPTSQAVIAWIATEEPLFNIDLPVNISLELASDINLTPPTFSLPRITNISPIVTIDFQLPTFSGM